MQKRREEKQKKEEEEIRRKEEDAKKLSQKSKIPQKNSQKSNKKGTFDLADAFDNEDVNRNEEIFDPLEKKSEDEEEKVSEDIEISDEPKPIIYDTEKASNYAKFLQESKNLLVDAKTYNERPTDTENNDNINNNAKFETSPNNLTDEKSSIVSSPPKTIETNQVFDPSVMEKYLNSQRNPINNKNNNIFSNSPDVRIEESPIKDELDDKKDQKEEKKSEAFKEFKYDEGLYNFNKNLLASKEEEPNDPIVKEAKNQIEANTNKLIQDPTNLEANKKEKNITIIPDINSYVYPPSNIEKKEYTFQNTNQKKDPDFPTNTALIDNFKNQDLEQKIKELTLNVTQLTQTNTLYQAEVENLLLKVDQLIADKQQINFELQQFKNLNDKKIQILNEKQNMNKTHALSEQNQIFEQEREIFLLEIEKLKDEIKILNEKLEKSGANFKSQNLNRTNNELQTRELKKQIVELDLQLKGRQELNFRGEESNEISIFHKEIVFQELLIKGFQKENERVMFENRNLNEKMNTISAQLFLENKKNNELRLNSQKINNPINFNTHSNINSQVISQNLTEINLNLSKELNFLKEENENLKNTLKERHKEFEQQIETMKKEKREMQKNFGFNYDLIESEEKILKEMEEKHSLAIKEKNDLIKDLKDKITVYVKNQDNLESLKQQENEQNLKIKSLEAKIEEILNNPQSNLDLKSKHYQKQSANDHKKIKKLEKLVQELEESLSKKQPILLENMKNQSEKDKKITELSLKAQNFEKLLKRKEEEYQNKIVEFMKELDRVKIDYQKNRKTKSPKKIKKNNNNFEKIEIDSEINEIITQLKDKLEAKEHILLKKENEPPSINVPSLFLFGNSEYFQFLNQIYENNEKMKRFLNERNSQEMLQMIFSSDENLKKLNQLENIERLKKRFENLKTLLNKIKVKNQENEWIELEIEFEAFTKELEEFVTVNIRNNNFPRKVKQNNFFEENVTSPTFNFQKADQIPQKQNKNTIENQEISTKSFQLEEENMNLQSKVKTYLALISKLTDEKENLKNLISNLDRNPNKNDYFVLEKKLELMERNFQKKELEINNTLKHGFNIDNSEEMGKMKRMLERERRQFTEVLARKNKEIEEIKRELEEMIFEMEGLRRERLI